MIAKTPDFLELAGSVPVPAAKRGTARDAVLRATRGAPCEATSLSALVDTNVLIGI